MTHHAPIDAPRGASPDLDQARRWTRRAGHWLVLIGFRVHPGAPTLGPDVVTYHDLLDPASTDERRRDACLRLLPHVRRQAEHERWEAEGDRVRRPASDPRRWEWRTTPRGAALETAAELLGEALVALDPAG